jgi:hypothetical protein
MTAFSSQSQPQILRLGRASFRRDLTQDDRGKLSLTVWELALLCM